MRFLTPVFLGLVGCASSPTEDTDTDTGTPLCEQNSIENGQFGRSFALDYCTGCHSSHLAENERGGSPIDLNANSLEGLRNAKDRILARCESWDAHPCADLPKAEAERFIGWLECGAPGQEVEVEVSSPFPSGEAFEVAARVEQTNEGLLLTRHIELGTRGVLPEAPWSETLFLAQNQELWLLTESLFREDGSLLWQVDFPNGYLLDNGTPNHREETIWVEIYDDGLEVEEEWRVVLDAGHYSEPYDGREVDLNPKEIHLVSDTGAEWLWHWPYRYSISFKMHWVDSDRGWSALRIQDEKLAEQFETDAVLGLENGRTWIERVVVPEGWSL